MKNKTTKTDAAAIAGSNMLLPSASDEKWIKKFSKSKLGQLVDLKYEYNLIAQKANTNSYVAAALWIVVKGTKMETDGRFFIELADQNFFDGEN